MIAGVVHIKMIAVSAPRRFLLLLLVAWIAAPVLGELYQRRVCPKVSNWKPRELCKGVVHKCDSDDQCAKGERCCPTDKECFLSCQKTVIPDGCPIPIDLALLLDSSGSIDRKEWEKVLKTTMLIVDNFDISEKGTHIAIMMYSSYPEIMIRFNKYTGVDLNAVNIKRDVSKFRLQRGLTFIDKALILAAEDLFTERSGMRKEVQKVAIVFTDGVQTRNRGPFMPLEIASSILQAKDVNVYSIGVGGIVQLLEMNNIASSKDFIFSTRNFTNLPEKAREIVKALCQACKEVVELVFGIPDSSDIHANFFSDIKTFFLKLSNLFKVSNRNNHIGVIRYSDSANLPVKLNEIYQMSDLSAFINSMKPTGTGVNLEQALRIAADHAFTIFGGVRQIYPKTFVVFVPKQTTVSEEVIKQASLKLKSVGVRLLLVMLDSHPQLEFFKTISSQPKERYILKGLDMEELIKVASYEAVDTICRGGYGKCPMIEAPGPCPAINETRSCTIDSNCGDEGYLEAMCCYSGNCGRGSCIPRVWNCFVTMDVAFAIDSSAAVSDEDFEASKKFVKNLIHAFADSENSIHFGIVQYGATAKRIADFNTFISDPSIKEIVNKLTKSNNGTRRVDLALETLKKEVFSLEGGMRQGHPRYVIFLAGGDTDAASADLAKASKPLRDLDVNIFAVGVNSGASKEFLSKLASNPNYVFPAASPDALSTNRMEIEKTICHAKPGDCKPVERPPDCEFVTVPEEFVPCGESADGAPTGNEADWICPGEQKCCVDPNNPCATICTDPPNECRGQYDLTFVLENSDDVGAQNFDKMKTFAKDLVSAFMIGSFGSRVALVTYGGSARVEFKFNSISGATKEMIFNATDQVRFQSGPGGGVSAGLQKALDSVYTGAGGVRERSNKSLVIIGSGKFQDAKKAALLANQLKQSQVDLFAVPVGGRGDIAAIRNIVSENIEKNAFITTSYDALRPQLRALTKAVCDGAEKLRQCKGVHDLAILIEGNDDVGQVGFDKVKTFVKQITNGFNIRQDRTRVSVVSYSEKPHLDFKFNTIQNSTKQKLGLLIERIPFPGGGASSTARALQMAYGEVFKNDSGARERGVHKSLLIISQGKFLNPTNAARYASLLIQNNVDVYFMAIGGNEDIPSIRNVTSKPQHKTVFITSTYDALKPHLRAVTNRICDGAEKPNTNRNRS